MPEIPSYSRTALRAVPAGTLVKVRAAPAAGRERISPHGDALKVAVPAPPERGKANEAIARLLASRLGLQPSRVSIQSGESSRDKWFLIAGMALPGVKRSSPSSKDDAHDQLEGESRRRRGRHTLPLLAPSFGITLGTGLGGLTREITAEVRIPYQDIPGFPEPRVTSHQGALVLGHLGGRPVAALEGRYHYYEGYALEEITLPVRVLRALGVETAIFSNAAGGLRPSLRAGDILVIEDHINLMGVNPLVGPNEEALGPRFPDMCAPYDLRLVQALEDIARRRGIRASRGVYAAMTGPCLETRAEYRYLQTIGVDAIGMSTVPEVIVAVHAGLRVVGLSCITDLCLPDALRPVNIDEILRIAGEAEPKMTALVRELIEGFPTFL